MEFFKKKKNTDPHPYIPELKESLQQGKISRREFLRNATLLGMSATAAYAFANPLNPFGVQTAYAGNIQRGGTWTCAQNLQLIDHPSRISWLEASNVVGQVAEYLTETGEDNITRPWLLEKWVASEDLKTWDLYLRKGIKFNNGDEFQADDVIFTFSPPVNTFPYLRHTSA